jgi:ABC-type lipoprotein release transport system permease subunit
MNAVDPTLPLQSMSTMESRVARTTARPRFYATVLIVFSGTALGLTLLGVYGLVSYFVTQRRHDLGIHVALGARTVDVVRIGLGTGLRPVVSGLVLGAALSVALGRALEAPAAAAMLQGLLFRVRAVDALPIVIAASALLVTAVVASYLPARRAGRIDPVAALRE